jgi:hypothetical protein
MMAPSFCEDLRQGLGALFVCSPQGRYLRIRTPYLYPDGDVIDLFCHQEAVGPLPGEELTITDLGETIRWLRLQTLSPKRSAKQRALIEDICLTHGVEFYKGMLQARCRPGESVAAVVLRVAQAAIRVADLWLAFRTRSVESVKDEVADWLTKHQFPFEREKKLAGRSGRTWVVDFHVRVPARSSLVYVLSTGSRAAARSIAEHVLAAWYDLNHLTVGPEALQCVSLFDDTLDVWNPEDFRLVESLSTVVKWSDPAEFQKALLAA